MCTSIGREWKSPGNQQTLAMRPISEEQTRHMRKDPDQLPPAKQRELERVVQILFEEFEEARRLRPRIGRRKGRILKIILYGSYARGGWVDEPHTAKGYQSDFDLLIIVNDDRLTDRVQYWVKAEERLNRELCDHQKVTHSGQFHRPLAERGE